MRNNVWESKARAEAAWIDVAWPTLMAVGFFGPSPTIVANPESQDTDLLHAMDCLGTIDTIIKPNGKLLTYALRMHFQDRIYPHLTVRWKLASGHETEFEKLSRDDGSLKAGRCLQAYMLGRKVLAAYDVKAIDVISAINKRELDAVQVDGGNTMIRCHISWLQDDGAALKIYDSRQECHNVNDPTVDRLIAHYGRSGRREYEPYIMRPPLKYERRP